MNRSLRPLLATTLIFLFAYILAVTQQPAMLSTRVLGNFLTDNAFLGIAAVGMTFVILSGGIDLSVGAVIGFTTVLVAVLIMWLQLHPLVAFTIALIVATAFGAIMGAAIHYLKVPSFIVTLAGMFLARGGASVLSPDSIGIEHPFFTAVQKSYILLPGGGRLTVVGMIMLAVFAVAILLAHRTRFGDLCRPDGRPRRPHHHLDLRALQLPRGPRRGGLLALHLCRVQLERAGRRA
jgi:ribose/xylose/arabinose/galactoside ABC-type transport system permease subunit